jgi:hypothetical protein
VALGGLHDAPLPPNDRAFLWTRRPSLKKPGTLPPMNVDSPKIGSSGAASRVCGVTRPACEYPEGNLQRHEEGDTLAGCLFYGTVLRAQEIDLPVFRTFR